LNKNYVKPLVLVVLGILFGFALSPLPAYPWSGDWDTYSQGYAEPYRVNSTWYGLSGVDITPRLQGTWDVDLSTPNLDSSGYVNATEFYLNGENVTDPIKFPEIEETFIVWFEGSTVYAKHGNGTLTNSSTSTSTVLQDCVDRGTALGGAHIKIREGDFPIFTDEVVIDGGGDANNPLTIWIQGYL